MTPCIELKNISSSYDHTFILEHISFSVNTGDYVGIIGPNGGGKTTLIKIILGILQPTSGEIFLFEKEVSKMKNREYIGYVPQKITQGDFAFPATVNEIMLSGLTSKLGVFHSFHKHDYDAVKNALSLVGMNNFENRQIRELSGGERQRIFIARALVGKPKILILDEPTIGVDTPNQKSFYNLLEELNKNFKITILLISHDIEVITKKVKTVLCLNKKLVCHVTPQIFKKNIDLDTVYGESVKRIKHQHE